MQCNTILPQVMSLTCAQVGLRTSPGPVLAANGALRNGLMEDHVWVIFALGQINADT